MVAVYQLKWPKPLVNTRGNYFRFLAGHHKAYWFGSAPRTKQLTPSFLICVKTKTCPDSLTNRTWRPFEWHTCAFINHQWASLGNIALNWLPVTNAAICPLDNSSMQHSLNKVLALQYCHLSLGPITHKAKHDYISTFFCLPPSANRNQRPRRALGVCGGMRSGFNSNQPKHILSTAAQCQAYI